MMHQPIDASPIIQSSMAYFWQTVRKQLQKYRAELDWIHTEQPRLEKQAYAKRMIIKELEDVLNATHHEEAD